MGDKGAKIDKNDRILYNHKTGDLSYDGDGSNKHFDAVKFAHLDSYAHLTAADFFVV